MVTEQQIREYVGRRPFRAFRVTLCSGETIDVVRTAQAAASSRLLIVGMADDRMRWIRHDQIDAMRPLDFRQAAS